MTTWTKDELTKIGSADELQIASVRSDGTLSKPVTIWSVPYGGSLYVRSVNGPTASWFRGTQTTHKGHIRVSGVDKDVTFAEPEGNVADELDTAYRAKYRRYSAGIVNSIVSPKARSATVKVIPS
jgi:hypothetical protein